MRLQSWPVLFVALMLGACGDGTPSPSPSPAAGEALAEGPLLGREQVAFPATGEGLITDPALITGVLENGLRYAIYPNDTPEDQLSIRLTVETGSLDETPGIQGIAHYLEHMAFNGSQNVPEGEMVKILEREGLAFGPDTNAFTSFEITNYMLDLPNNEADTIEAAFFLMGEAADKLTLDETAIDRERGIILSEYRTRVDYEFEAYLASAAFFFPGLRTTSFLPIGTLEDIEGVDAADFRAFYDRYYRPEHALVTVVGSIEPEAALAQIERHFGDWEAGGGALPLPAPGTVDDSRAGEGAHFHHPDIANTITLRWVTQTGPAPAESAETWRRSMVDGIAEAIVERRIARAIRGGEDSYLAGSYTHTRHDQDLVDLLTLTIVAREGEENIRQATRRFAELHRAGVEGPITQGELDEQKQNWLRWYQDSAEGADTRRNRSLASSIRGDLLTGGVFQHPRDSLVWAEGALASITLQDIRDALREHLPERAPLVFVTTSLDNDQLDEAALEGWRAAQEGPVSAAFVPEDVTFAYAEWGPAGEVVDEAYIDDIDTHTFRFANNVRLNVKQTDFDDDTVYVSLAFGRGTLEPDYEDAQGLSGFTGFVFTEGGLEAHTRDELTSLFSGRRVSAGFNLGTEEHSAFATTDADDLEDQLGLMTAYFVAPGWREEPVERYHRSLEERFRGLRATPQAVWSSEASNELCPEDPRCVKPELEEYARLNLDQAKAAMSRALAEGHMEVAIVGDVDVAQARDAVAATLATLPMRRAEPLAVSRERRFGGGTPMPVVYTHEGEENRAMVAVAWPAPDASDRRAARIATLAARVFDIKMTVIIREAEALTYSPSVRSVHSEVYEGYGYVLVTVDVAADSVERTMTVIEEAADAMAAGTISADEFERARTPLLEGVDNSLRENGYWINLLSDLQTDPAGLPDHRSRASDYQSITREEVQAMAAGIFVAGNAKRIHIIPD